LTPPSLLVSTVRPLRMSALFPYTTLFRSVEEVVAGRAVHRPVGRQRLALRQDLLGDDVQRPRRGLAVARRAEPDGDLARQEDPRSEEHTSELQSQSNLVCRLLLEKKKNHG